MLTSLSRTYSILGGSGVDNLGLSLSVINGNVASSSPLTGFPPGIVVGSIDINNANYNSLRDDITLQYNNYVNCQCQSLGDMNMNNAVFTPGMYCYDELILSGTVTFNTLLNPNGVFVIRANRIIIADLTIMSIIGDGIIGCNVVFVSTDDIQIGTTTVLTGTFISQNDIYYIQTPSILPQSLLTGSFYSINGKVELWNVVQTLCSCYSGLPSSSSTPSMSTTPTATSSSTPTPSVSSLPSSSPSPTLPVSCLFCPKLDTPTLDFSILSGGSLTNLFTSLILGDVGVSTTISGFTPGMIIGNTEYNTPSYLSAKNEITLAYNSYMNCDCQSSGNQILQAPIITPGVYCYDRLTLNGGVRFDNSADPNGIFVIIAESIIIESNTIMTLTQDNVPGLCKIAIISKTSINIFPQTILLGTMIAQQNINYVPPSSGSSITNVLEGHLYTIFGNININNLYQRGCSCLDNIITSSVTPLPSMSTTPLPSSSMSPTQTCTSTPTITPQKRCDCQCDIHGNTHVSMYDMVIAADKSGTAYGLNAKTGEEIWKTVIGPGGYLGGSSWGGASDGKNYVYYNIINNEHKEWRLTPSNEITTSGGWVKVDIWTGDIVWSTRVPEDPMNPVVELWATGPPTLVNDLLVTTSVNGRLYLLDTMTGDILWNEHIANTIYGGASADNTNCIYVGSGYRFDGLLEDNRVFQFCIGEPISYSVKVE
jgi:hypothetical protein